MKVFPLGKGQVVYNEDAESCLLCVNYFQDHAVTAKEKFMKAMESWKSIEEVLTQAPVYGQSRFNEQREAMFDEFKESMNTYVANSYSQYIEMFDVLTGDVDALKSGLDESISTHNAILDFTRNRNRVNAQLNETLTEIISDPDSMYLLKPFVEKLEWFIKQDELMIGRQYLSLDEALFLVSGGQS